MAVKRWAASIGIAVVLAGCTVRVSVNANGGDPNSSSGGPAVSANGRFVAFTSLASNLAHGDGNGLQDVYRRDLEKHETVRVSVDKGGGDPNFDSYDASISADGNKVAFVSLASDLVDDDTNGRIDVFVRDVRARVTTRASVGVDGEEANVAATPTSRAVTRR
jgi:Tol biopolymer transport system component